LQRTRLTKVASREVPLFRRNNFFLMELKVGNYPSKKPFLLTIVVQMCRTSE